MKRTNDPIDYKGWIRRLNSTTVSIESASPCNFTDGDEVTVEIESGKKHISLKTKVRETNADGIVLEIDNEKDLLPVREKSRLTAPAFKTLVKTEGEDEPIPTRLLDVSSNGMLLVSEKPLDEGIHLAITVESDFGDVQCTGEIRSCKTQRDGGPFQIGILLDEMNRIEKARWQSFFGKVAA